MKNDLISREDLIDWLTSRIIMLKGIYGDLGGAVSGVREMVKVMPSAEPERRWIPVTEALPEEDIDVLLQFPHTMGVGYQEDGFWNITTCDDLYSGLDEADAKPIAWMPLPEPWRGEYE